MSDQWQVMKVWIDKCYCENKSFEGLIKKAAAEGLTLPQLAAKEGCGTHCGWCVAYLRRALQTGETRFNVMLPKEPLHTLDDAFRELDALTASQPDPPSDPPERQ
jgi:bacterioferritin-associated ferredoxin